MRAEEGTTGNPRSASTSSTSQLEETSRSPEQLIGLSQRDNCPMVRTGCAASPHSAGGWVSSARLNERGSRTTSKSNRDLPTGSPATRRLCEAVVWLTAHERRPHRSSQSTARLHRACDRSDRRATGGDPAASFDQGRTRRQTEPAAMTVAYAAALAAAAVSACHCRLYRITERPMTGRLSLANALADASSVCDCGAKVLAIEYTSGV